MPSGRVLSRAARCQGIIVAPREILFLRCLNGGKSNIFATSIFVLA